MHHRFCFYLEALIPFIFLAPNNVQLQVVVLVVSQFSACRESFGAEVSLDTGHVRSFNNRSNGQTLCTNLASSKFCGATILVIFIRSLSVTKHTGNVWESVLLHAENMLLSARAISMTAKHHSPSYTSSFIVISVKKYTETFKPIY